LKRLDDRFNLLKGGLRTVLPRHQTLRAAIEWSYDLLSDQERLLFTRLAVFMGGWTLEAAEEVCSGGDIEPTDILDLLSQLVNKSLVVVAIVESGRRYRRLETIRQFASEVLDKSGEEEHIRARHLDYFVRLAEEGFLYYLGERALEWRQKLDPEYENIRAALEWSLQGNNTTVGQQLAGALGWYWSRSGLLREGYEWLQRMLAVSTGNESPFKARMLVTAAWKASELSYNDQAEAFARECLALYRQAGDKAGIANHFHTGDLCTFLPS
jgi:non-specific serine/threonine protein kinase